MSGRIRFLGCPVDNLTMSQVVERLEGYVATREPHTVIALNAAKLWRMERDPELGRIVRGADLVIPEKAIVMGARVLGMPFAAHIGGIMLVQRMLGVAAARGYRVFFLGARDEILERMLQRVTARYPSIRLAGWHHGYFDDHAGVAARVKAAEADLLFVAMGTPAQERWIAEYAGGIGTPVVMGVGGTFDVLSGVKKDAPRWVRTLALEWLYRLLQDPRNLWRRYLVTIPWFWYRVLIARVSRRR